jgi:hypothetical protein
MLNKSPNKSDATGGCTLEPSALQHVMWVWTLHYYY